MVLLIDNYDSFSYNLYQLVGELEPDIRVVRNDEVDVAGIRALAPSRIILSPGPGRPADAGVCEDVVRGLGGEVPILGVCLGHQAICEAYGGVVTYAKELMHGKPSTVVLDTSSPLFAGLPERVQGARYHSLAAPEDQLPACLRVIARTDDGEVMAVAHASQPVYGMQFHPESILTPEGRGMLGNFMRL
ncbi:MAG: aminodeoxychorismate/anthranilate synthase component II [Clostridiales Family XIII bacterium]|nr:aminodeoxychorismate/anthranilate synthase component II [Clostridiales Family XIII bacterium]